MIALLGVSLFIKFYILKEWEDELLDTDADFFFLLSILK